MCQSGLILAAVHVLHDNWSNENGCTEEKNKPVQARYAPLC